MDRQTTSVQLTQTHDGTGDNIGRDKIINNILGKSVEYNERAARISDLELLLSATTDPAVRLKISGQLNEARDQLKQFKDDVLRLAEIFTKIEVNTERLRIAKEHFEAGRLREADAILKAEELADDQTSLLTAKESKQEELHDIEEKLNNNANEYLVKARLKSLNYHSDNRIEKTCEYFELALKSSRLTNILFEYALFLQDHKSLDKAQLLYEELLNTYLKLAPVNQQEYEPEMTKALNNLGALQQTKDSYEAARFLYDEALKIHRGLVGENPLYYELDMARTLDNLGLLYKKRNNFEQSEMAYKEALVIYRRFAITNSQTYEPYIAITQENLGCLYHDKDDFELAEAAYQEALEINTRFACDNPEVYEPVVANALNNLAILYKAKGDIELTRKTYWACIDIYEQLANAQPQLFELKLSSVLLNYGLTLIEFDLPATARDMISFAKEIALKYPDFPLARHIINTSDHVLESK